MSVIASSWLACAISAAFTQSGSAPLVHEIPLEVFSVKIDGFKQVIGTVVSCGTLPSEITTITPIPVPPADANFRFVASEKSLALQVDAITKGKTKPIAAGGFDFDGKSLRWTLRTFPVKDARKGIDQVVAYLGTCAFVAVLRDGSTAQLSPPILKLTGRVEGTPGKPIEAPVEFLGMTPDAQLTLVSSAPGTWSDPSTEAGVLRGTVDGIKFELRAEIGKLLVYELSPEYRRLEKLRAQLASDRALLPTLKPTQRALLQAECEASAREEVELARAVREVAGKRFQTTLIVRAANPVSGRVLGEMCVEVKR